jgi:hypothetical protein
LPVNAVQYSQVLGGNRHRSPNQSLWEQNDGGYPKEFSLQYDRLSRRKKAAECRPFSQRPKDARQSPQGQFVNSPELAHGAAADRAPGDP